MLLSIRNLHKTYRLGRAMVPVLRGVDLTVQRGEWVALLGASGSGKSTLLHLVGGLDRPDRRGKNGLAGSIEFDGAMVTRMGQRALDKYRAESVGFVFQFYHLLPELTVLQNVLLSAMVRLGRVGYLTRRSELRESASRLLDDVGLGHRLRHRPVELSGGERQRVAIARALLNRPTLLLADEPTGNLDRKTGGSIMALLEGLRTGSDQTMLLVTHDPEVAARADRVVTLVDGQVEASPGDRPEPRPAGDSPGGGLGRGAARAPGSAGRPPADRPPTL